MLRPYIFIIIIILLFQGCLYNSSFIQKEDPIDFNQISKSLANKLISNLPLVKNNKTIIVSDFVNIDTKTNNSTIGFILSSSIKSYISNNKKLNLQEINMSKNIIINKYGINVISNNINKLKSTKFDIDYILVGQYKITLSQLIIFTSIIDVESSNILSASTTAVDITDEISNMIYDL
jgi:TolB-like protein